MRKALTAAIPEYGEAKAQVAVLGVVIDTQSPEKSVIRDPKGKCKDAARKLTLIGVVSYVRWHRKCHVKALVISKFAWAAPWISRTGIDRSVYARIGTALHGKLPHCAATILVRFTAIRGHG